MREFCVPVCVWVCVYVKILIFNFLVKCKPQKKDVGFRYSL